MRLTTWPRVWLEAGMPLIEAARGNITRQRGLCQWLECTMAVSD